MGLMDLSHEELIKKATKYGVEGADEKTPKSLRKLIRKAREEKAAKETKKATKSGTSAWPKAWVENDMHSVYYQEIVGQQMPDNEKKAYRHLLRVIDDRAVKEEVPRPGAGGEPDCFGLYFHEALKTCVEQCPHMPLCKAIIEKRPELVKAAEELDAAAAEVDELSDEEKEEATKAHVKKSKKSKPKKEEKPKKRRRDDDDDAEVVKERRFVWCGHLSEFEDDLADDKDLAAIYKWMAKHTSKNDSVYFTTDELADQFKRYGYDDPRAAAKEQIKFLREADALRKVKA